jgi:hypothetical protein
MVPLLYSTTRVPGPRSMPPELGLSPEKHHGAPPLRMGGFAMVAFLPGD